MRCPKNRARVGALASVLALLSNFVVLSFGYAGSTLDPPDLTTPGQREGVVTSSDGSLKLMANAPPAPAVYGTFKHFGLSISPALQFSTSFRTIRIDYDAQLPPASAVRIDVRASADQSRWTAWETDLATGATASFAIAARFAQYRVTLLGNGGAGPVVRAISLVPSSGSAVYTTMEDTPQPVAPTFRIHGTREGLVGARTANGHHITAHDHFVSLPSWRSLSSKDGREYLVRITYNGHSSVAPVYDVGPWNIHDNYWDEHRDRFGDLPRGWPEDHAAFFDKYNAGRAEKGHVSFPTAIDVGDGVWRDDLGIAGDQAVVEVTFLWLGRDPLAAPPPPAPPAPPPPAEAAPPAPPAPPPAPPPAEAAPAPPPAPPAPAEAVPAPPAPPPAPPPAEAAPAPPAPPPAPPPPAEIVVDDHDGAFKPHAPTWYHSPGDCGAGGHALWTYTTPNPAESENTARWQPALPAEGLYDLYVAVPACNNGHPNTGSARYLIQHRDGAQTIAVDQAASAGTWALLGRFPFAAGDAGFVELNDVTADSMHVLWYDAVKWVAVR